MSGAGYCLVLTALAAVALLQSATASNVVFVPAAQQSGTSINPALEVKLDARAVWYKCGFKSWDQTRFLVNTIPPTQEYTAYMVRRSDVRYVNYKADGGKKYPLSARSKCSRQVLCDQTSKPVYLNYFERCLVVSSDSSDTALSFTVSASSKMEIKVFLLWAAVGLVALILALAIINCLWSCLCGCCPSKPKYGRY